MNGDYLKKQIITYMGNKRKLLGQINDIIDMVENELGYELICADAFQVLVLFHVCLKPNQKNYM